MKTVKNFIKNVWECYCQAMALAYYPYWININPNYMKHESSQN